MSNENNFNFGARLRELRKERGLTQKKLGAMLSFSYDTISLWEKNKSRPDFENIKKLAKIFNVSSDYLLGLSDNYYDN